MSTAKETEYFEPVRKFRLGSKIILHGRDKVGSSVFMEKFAEYKVWTVCRYRVFSKSAELDSHNCPRYKVTLKCHTLCGFAYDWAFLRIADTFSKKPINLNKTTVMTEDFYVSDLDSMIESNLFEVVEY